MNIRLFQTRDVNQAVNHAMGGGQALHLFTVSIGREQTPFKPGTRAAHLLDQDAARLERTARRLGVTRVVVDQAGTPRQHVNLCRQPLVKALAIAGKWDPRDDPAGCRLRTG